MVVILLVVLGGFALVGCVVLGGFFFLAVSAPATITTMPAKTAATNAQAKISSHSSGVNVLKVTKTARVAPGQYEVTIIDTQTETNETCDSYLLLIEKVATPKTEVKIRGRLRTKPLPGNVESLLLIKTTPEQKTVKFSYIANKSSDTLSARASADMVIDLQNAVDGKKEEAKTPKEKASTPK